MSSSLQAKGWRPSVADWGGAAPRVQWSAVAGNGWRIMCRGIISSCQSAATSEIVKRCCSSLCKQYSDLYLYLYIVHIQFNDNINYHFVSRAFHFVWNSNSVANFLRMLISRAMTTVKQEWTADLTTATEFARNSTSDSRVNIGRVKDNERSIAAELHWDPLHWPGSLT